jgi:hypothetical protein
MSGQNTTIQRDPPADEAEQEAAVEAVHDEATAAAEQSWLPGGVASCPYADDDWRANIWQSAFGNALIRDWH